MEHAATAGTVYGRLRTADDGRGNTITYSYDNADRITKVDYSDSTTHDVTFTYDAEAHIKTRVDGSGDLIPG